MRLTDLVMGKWYRYDGWYFQPMQLNTKKSKIKICNRVDSLGEYLENCTIDNHNVWQGCTEPPEYELFGKVPNYKPLNYSIWN